MLRLSKTLPLCSYAALLHIVVDVGVVVVFYTSGLHYNESRQRIEEWQSKAKVLHFFRVTRMGSERCISRDLLHINGRVTAEWQVVSVRASDCASYHLQLLTATPSAAATKTTLIDDYRIVGLLLTPPPSGFDQFAHQFQSFCCCSRYLIVGKLIDAWMDAWQPASRTNEQTDIYPDGRAEWPPKEWLEV